MNALPPVDAPNAHDLYEGVDYQRYWRGIARQKLDELERTIICSLLPKQGQRLIDLGCGYGRLFNTYVDSFAEIVLFDGSESLLQMAQHNIGEKAIYVLGDINNLPFQPAAFDAALMVRVFHHMNDPAKCIGEIQRVLCSGGKFVMNYSNKRNALRIVQFLLKRTLNNPFTYEPLTAEVNFLHHHPVWVSQLLFASGFEKPVYRGAGVLDKLAGHVGLFNRIVPRGALLAPLLGRTATAPWIFCKVQAQKRDLSPPITNFEDALACPLCNSRLIKAASRYECGKCSKSYPIDDGIIDMRLEKSR